MSNGPVKSVTLSGGRNFNITRANAVQQKTLMTLIGNRILANSLVLKGEIDRDFVMGVLLSTDESTLDNVCRIVLHKTIESGGSDLVTLDSWQYGITEWFELVAHAIEVNLSDFFIWLDARRDVKKPAGNDKPAI